MMVTFSKTESQLHISQIEEVEKFIGLNFPVDYKTHLLQNNGGQCVPNGFEFHENGNRTSSYIDWFLAIYDGKYDNLKTYLIHYKIEEKRMPSTIFPIAHDPGGNLICISCDGVDKGFIYFWDHENEVSYNDSPNDNDYSNLYLIAKSFEDFINGLK